MPDNLYIIDTSSVIRFNRHFNFSIFKSLRNDMDQLIKRGMLIAPIQVLNEIEKQDDSSLKWVQARKAMFRDNYTDYTMQMLGKIIGNHEGWLNLEGEDEIADPYLIALALDIRDSPQSKLANFDDICVVTEEHIKGNKLKIPLVCIEYNLLCCDLIGMYTKENWEY